MIRKMIPDPKSSFRTIRRKALSSDSFLEALRDLGGGVADSLVHDVAGGIAQEGVNQLTGQSKGELKPNQPVNLEELKKTQEKQTFSIQQEYLNIRQQEKLVFSQTEQEIKLQIKVVLEELKKLSRSTENLAKEVKVASEQAPVDPGIYHLSFFEKLRQTLILLKKQIDESATWLAAFNQKTKRRNYYWAQVRKSGTKFMLSQERYMATQAG